MLTLLKLLQSLVKTLHSEGTPGQIAAALRQVAEHEGEWHEIENAAAPAERAQLGQQRLDLRR